jgi:hypothetical protein
MGMGVLFFELSTITPVLFSRTLVLFTPKAGLHPSWKLAQENALFRINLAFGPDDPYE